MPIVEQDEFGSFLMEAVPGRKRQVQQDPDPNPINGNVIDVVRLANQARETGQGLYPTEPLTEEQFQRFGQLAAREQRLAPIESIPYGGVGSARIPGNPYSVDTRGAARGLGNLILGLVNKKRANRRGEYADELAGLTAQQRQNIENRERQEEFFNETFPELVNQEGQTVRNREDNQRMRDVAETDREGQMSRTQAEIEGRSQRDKQEYVNDAQVREEDRKFEREMENLKAKNDRNLQLLKNSGGSGGSGGLSGGERQSIAEDMTAEANAIWDEIQELNAIAADPVKAQIYNSGLSGPEKRLEQQLEDKTKRYIKLRKERAQINLNLAGGKNPDTGTDFSDLFGTDGGN